MSYYSAVGDQMDDLRAAGTDPAKLAAYNAKYGQAARDAFAAEKARQSAMNTINSGMSSGGSSVADSLNSMFSSFGMGTPKATPKTATGPRIGTIQGAAPRFPAYATPYAPPASSGTVMGIKIPYLIGGVAILGVAAFLLTRKKNTPVAL